MICYAAAVNFLRLELQPNQWSLGTSNTTDEPERNRNHLIFHIETPVRFSRRLYVIRPTREHGGLYSNLWFLWRTCERPRIPDQRPRLFPVRSDVQPHQLSELVAGDGLAEIIALRFVTGVLAQEHLLLQRLDPFGDDGEVEGLAHGDDRAGDRLVLWILQIGRA